MRKFHIYLIGVALLGLMHDLVKAAMPNGLVFIVLCVTYLLTVRAIAERFGQP